MNTNEIHYLVTEKLKRGYVYPGHPIVIAYCITRAFKSLDEALSYETDPDGKKHFACRALESREVPGAGSNVYGALEYLQDLRSGTSFDEATLKADGDWKYSCHEVFRDRVKPGQAQADEVKPLLKEMTNFWKKV